MNNFQIEMMVNIFMEKYPIIQCLIERMKDGILEEIDVTQVLQIFAEMLSPENIFGPEMVSKNMKSCTDRNNIEDSYWLVKHFLDLTFW